MCTMPPHGVQTRQPIDTPRVRSRQPPWLCHQLHLGRDVTVNESKPMTLKRWGESTDLPVLISVKIVKKDVH